MTLRRALSASPLAVLVAVFAHFVAFGYGHVPGADRAPELFGTLGAALALAAAGAFASGLLAGTRRGTESAPSAWYGPLLLAVAGTASFAGIEFGEGHVAVDALLRVAFASIPLAYAVAFVARSMRSAVRAAGASYGDFVSRTLSRAKRVIAFVAREGVMFSATSIVAGGPARGRAPPVLI